MPEYSSRGDRPMHCSSTDCRCLHQRAVKQCARHPGWNWLTEHNASITQTADGCGGRASSPTCRRTKPHPQCRDPSMRTGTRCMDGQARRWPFEDTRNPLARYLEAPVAVARDLLAMDHLSVNQSQLLRQIDRAPAMRLRYPQRHEAARAGTGLRH